jgi:formamidopyrimidine-DNA glycosylase
MPELPEVHTTATILHKLIRNKKITDVWSNYKSTHYDGKENIKDILYFKKFKKEILNDTIVNVSRRAKNILIELKSGKFILTHMKMTGHFLCGTYLYNKKKNSWHTNKQGPLQDSFNQHIRFVLTFSDNTHLVLSDMRKFATISLISNKEALKEKLSILGVEPLEKDFDWNVLKTCLSKYPKQKVKTILMNQSLVVGIGNIYSDEILWKSKIHPERLVLHISDTEYKILTKNIREILSKGISFKGDSTSDYRNPYGAQGEFQLHHNTYQRTGLHCKRKNCNQIIQRKVLGGRSAHFCPQCQK